MVSDKQKILYSLAIGLIMGFLIGYWGIAILIQTSRPSILMIFLISLVTNILQAIYIIRLWNEPRGD